MKVYCASLYLLASIAIVNQYASAFVTSKKASFVSPVVNSLSNDNSLIQKKKSTTSFASTAESSESLAKAPTFNGKLVMPMKIMKLGLKGHKVAAVYAVLNNEYKRGSEGWENCEYVGITKDLNAILQSQLNRHGSEKVANVRALSFAYPQKTAMAEIAEQWRDVVRQSGLQQMGNDEEWAKITVTAEEMTVLEENDIDTNEVSPIENTLADELEKVDESRREEVLRIAMFDDDDDDDDDDFEDDEEDNFVVDFSKPDETIEEENDSVVSPFSEEQDAAVPEVKAVSADEPLEFNKENVDKILNEIRPYLISDGGNVSVKSVDEETKNVYLVLEGACGSCPSSTVTMQMGIQRVLKENFKDLGEVVQVDENAGDESNENGLTIGAVEAELKRISPAITAMGGVVEIMNVDPLGVVELKFRGSTKIQQGLELALLDVPYVKHVKFIN